MTLAIFGERQSGQDVRSANGKRAYIAVGAAVGVGFFSFSLGLNPLFRHLLVEVSNQHCYALFRSL